MDAELYNKGELEVSIIDGDLVIEVGSKGASIVAKANGAYFLDKLAEKIPGEVDDAVINIIKAALKG